MLANFWLKTPHKAEYDARPVLARLAVIAVLIGMAALR
jgi:hypothetical protein